MSSFSITRKKTPFQKHREEKEAKKKRAEDETARLYEEFLESFQGEDAPGSKAFVRGGLINPNEKVKADSEGGNSKDGVSGSKKGSRYVPSFLPPPMAAKGREYEREEPREKSKEKEKGRMRNIDNFMEELKHEQEMREKRNQDRDKWREGELPTPITRFDELPDEFDAGRGSFDDGDPQTTNLYVGNLSPKVDESFLLRTFGRFGPIASVKIMWPRTEEERRRQRNCGFVAFMNRSEAQAAKDEMQGVVVYEYELKIGWGKSVALPSQALPAPPPGHMAIRSKEGGTVILSGSGTPVAPVSNQNSELVLTPNVPDITVVPPEDRHLRHVIDTMALYVLDGGCAFEQAIMERGRGNPLFSFLFDLGSKEHMYYVWRLYSFAQGDTLQRWRTEPFIMITGSGRWVPPPLPTAKSPDPEKDSSATYAAGRSRRIDPERTLTDSQRDEFEDMLRALTLERSQIKDAMGFSLDNADAAGEIVEVLTESLTLMETPIPTKVARLMLVSDILHNSSAPVKNASAYRTKFEVTLPDIMESFNDLYRSISGRITAEALKERVLKVLQVWSDWFLFSDAFVNGLRATFLRPSASGVIPFHSICGDVLEMEEKVGCPERSSDGSKTNQDVALAMGKGAAMLELRSLPLPELERRCRHNGLSLVGGREMMVARLLYLGEAEKQRGSELEDDLKYVHAQPSSAKFANVQSDVNVEMEAARSTTWNYYGDDVEARESNSLPQEFSLPQSEVKSFLKKEKAETVLPASKWAREEDDDEPKQSSSGLGLGYSSSGSENTSDDLSNAEDSEYATQTRAATQPEITMNEEQRQKLRRLEVSLMEYRESLEERGIKSSEEIEKKIAIYRKRLESDYGLSDSSENLPRIKRTVERRDKKDDLRESSRKRHRSTSQSGSPPRRGSNRETEDADRDYRAKDRSKSQDSDSERIKNRRDLEKSGGLERDDHQSDRGQDRDKDRRRRVK
ncbi:protein RRC1-like isoform X2 [Chenopodium quinoa]|uniref:protein RRC1-like isoform X2 n=1 Tax=Chenopodium quinoa TaxID=63459 RepID=UPI000B784962|nr:protein RRC1-like isoform X2 [Chenopodium quinoa]